MTRAPTPKKRAERLVGLLGANEGSHEYFVYVGGVFGGRCIGQATPHPAVAASDVKGFMAGYLVAVWEK